MATISTHPDGPELLAVAMGEPADEGLAGHLRGCQRCRNRVERLRDDVSALPPDPGGGEIPASTEQDPAMNHDGEPSDGGTTLTWVARPPGDAGAEPVEPKGRPQIPRAIGKYQVVELLGWGAEGEVYRVIHPNLGHNLVLKLARHPVGDDVRTSIIEEGQRLITLEKHANLLRVFDLEFHDDRRPFLVMEYVDGRNLEDYAREEPVTSRRAAELVAKLAGALAMVHRKGIIHCDIKPRNIMVDDVGEPRLIDFGLARLRGPWSDRDDLTWGGTLQFMAPEQVRREHDRIGPRSDIFGLGAVLYFLLTGRPPLVGETRNEIWDRARRCDFDAGALRIAKIPRPLERICLKALAADPADRYATAKTFERDLGRYLARPGRIAAGAAGAVTLLALGFSLSGSWKADLPSSPLEAPTTRRPVGGPPSVATPPGPTTGHVMRMTPTPPAGDRPAVHPSSEAWKGRIDLLVVKSKDGTRRRLRLADPGSVPLRAEDEFRIEARLDRPAYLYLFWLGSEGEVAPLYPWKDHDWSRRPAEERKVTGAELPVLLDEVLEVPASPPGLDTLVLLAREDSPLPTEDEVRLSRGLASGRLIPWPSGMNRAIWIEDGQEVTFEPTTGAGNDHGDKVILTRGIPSAKGRPSDDPVLRIRALMNAMVKPLGSYSQAVIFPNRGGS